MANYKGNKPKGKGFMITMIALGVLILGILAYRITGKIIEGGKKTAPLSFNVGSMVLTKQWLNEALTFEGLIQGDPQIFVYSQVAGKFQYNSVLEGTYVKKDEPISYLDRDIVGQDYNLAPVRSPISGIITKLYFIDKGAPVSTANPIAEVANPGRIKVVLSVSEDDLVKIKKGMSTKIYFERDPTVFLMGEVYTVTPYIDSSTLSGSVTVTAANPNLKLKIGMTVGVDIGIGKILTFVVPEEAVVTSLDKVYIFVNNHGIAKEVDITRGYAQNGMVEVKGDLNPGDEVITQGAFKLNDGDRIKTALSSSNTNNPGQTGNSSSKSWGKKK